MPITQTFAQLTERMEIKYREIQSLRAKRKKERKARLKLNKYRIYKACKKTEIYGIGLAASGIRGILNTTDFINKNGLPLLAPNSILLDSADEFAAAFGGYTKHSIGDKMLKDMLKYTGTAVGFSTKLVRKITNWSEKRAKKEILHSRMFHPHTR